jgi:hypothetical protein
VVFGVVDSVGVTVDRQRQIWFCCLACRNAVLRQPSGRLVRGDAFITVVLSWCFESQALPDHARK